MRRRQKPQKNVEDLRKMGDELSMFQSAQLRWLKQQVSNLQDEQWTQNARPNIQRELFSAREELENFVAELRKIGKKI